MVLEVELCPSAAELFPCKHLQWT